MRGAVRGVTPLRSIRMRERAYNFIAHFRVGRGVRTDCTNDCQYCHPTCRKLKLKNVYDPQREISRMWANPACVSVSA
jgi:hypothetical protein